MEQVNIKITNAALRRIKVILNNSDKKLRLNVTGGGCSGYQYEYLVTDEVTEFDQQIALLECVLVIDSRIGHLINNSEIDYIEELGQAYFKINNPQASAKCGCGSSFGI